MFDISIAMVMGPTPPGTGVIAAALAAIVFVGQIAGKWQEGGWVVLIEPVLIGVWELFGRDINPVFGSYPSAIAAAFAATSSNATSPTSR